MYVSDSSSLGKRKGGEGEDKINHNHSSDQINK